jgi:hypothetical protein
MQGASTAVRVLVVAGVLIAAMSGCSASRYTVPRILRSDSPVGKESGRPWYEQVNDDGAPRSYQIEVMNPFTYGDWTDKDVKNAQPSFYSVAAGWVSGAGSGERELARNQLQNAVIRLSDQAVSMHLSALKASESGWNNSLGFSTLALAAAATATTGGAATGLAAGATVTSGTRSLINEQEFRNALVESIIVLIEKDRAQALERIRQNQRQQIQAYDVEQAIADASDYHQRGSFYHGLALLAEAARKSGNELEQSTASLVRAKVELSKLMGQGDGKARLEKFLGFEPPKPGSPDQRSVAERVQLWIERALPDQIASAVSYLRASGNLTEAKSQLAAARATADRMAADLAEAVRKRTEAQQAEQSASAAASVELTDRERLQEQRNRAAKLLTLSQSYLGDANKRLAQLQSGIKFATEAKKPAVELQEQATRLQEEVARTEASLIPLQGEVSAIDAALEAKKKNIEALTAKATEATAKLSELQAQESELLKKLEAARKTQSELEERFYREQAAGTTPTVSTVPEPPAATPK